MHSPTTYMHNNQVSSAFLHAIFTLLRQPEECIGYLFQRGCMLVTWFPIPLGRKGNIFFESQKLIYRLVWKNVAGKIEPRKGSFVRNFARHEKL